MPINETHDPNLRSWVESANDPASDFPIQNLPLCDFKHPRHGEGASAGVPEPWHAGIRIGDQVLDLDVIREARLLEELNLADWLDTFTECMAGNLDSSPGSLIASLRPALQRFLRHDAPAGQPARRARASTMFPAAECAFRAAPFHIRNYTDFYASIHHATTVGSMFRPDNPLLPNYKHVPIGYHGRASSIVPSGTDIRRPRGQLPPPDDRPGDGPAFGPSRMLDYELEVGLFVGQENLLGEPVPIGRARDHILGLCLVNDWSARDMQKWEYQPLGPFLAKSFATTTSPYVVTLEALEPFRCPAYPRPAGDSRPLPYLLDDADQARGGLDITLEAWLRSAEMERRGMAPVRVSKSNAFKDMYWTIAQLLAHHTSNGCNLQSGDLLASGTVSGSEPGTRGCLLEATWQGRAPDGKPLPRRPIELPTGERRTFLEDGDEVILTGYCERDGFRRVGFGECRGRIISTLA
jgi:fumarylacetoacetase